VFHEVLPSILKTSKYELPGGAKAGEGALGELTQWRERALQDPRFALEKVRALRRKSIVSPSPEKAYRKHHATQDEEGPA
jgi:hypothetical protein